MCGGRDRNQIDGLQGKQIACCTTISLTSNWALNIYNETFIGYLLANQRDSPLKRKRYAEKMGHSHLFKCLTNPLF